MQQPQFLFPERTRFGSDNLVLHATARRHVVHDFAGPLSIKTVIRGEVCWTVSGRSLPVDPTTFLVLNDGERYSMDMNGSRPVETCCVFFRSGFVEEVAQDATSPLELSLDSPWRAARRLQFLSRLHSDTRGAILPQMWSLANRCGKELQPSSFEEDFLTLSHQLVMLYREVRDQCRRVPAAKASTREELFRRLQIAREYLHGNGEHGISLEEVSREACVSRYHLHRAFKQVFRLTPHAYLTALRLERARAMLRRGEAVTATAVDVGFTSVSAFTRLFRTRYGHSPSAVVKNSKIGQAQN
jgi:AraC family transcriptional regulator